VRESATQDDWANNLSSRVNQYTKIDRVSGTNITPEMDPKGNLAKDDTTGTKGYRCTYDAWDRLVKAATQDTNATVAQYRYNGLGIRFTG
jgi:YD repeat-containing protein